MTVRAPVAGLWQEDGMQRLCVPSSSGPGVQWCQPASGMQEGRAGVASAWVRRETRGSDCAAVGWREGSEGSRLGDQEDRQAPSFPEGREEQGPAQRAERG